MTIFRCYYKKLGAHVHCRFFSGPQKGALGKNGDLCFRVGEFADFTRIHRVLGIEFFREIGKDGERLGDDDVPFDTYERYMGVEP